ncbi:MAG TPA: VWA domain-containing protein [Planctomycetes bacterium]|nr:VWA domain-containing protein [Planctomycetota bacterium]
MRVLSFEHPLAFALLILLPLVFWARRRSRFPAVGFSRFPLAKGLKASLRQRLLPLLDLLEVLAVLCLVLAIARPFVLREVPERYRGVDILLCMDNSSSMNARDMDPQKTRLQLAKEAARQFAAARRNDRIGLLRFARYPDLLCPPTLDHFALGAWIEGMEVVPPDGDEDLTGIGAALAKAALVLSPRRPKSDPPAPSDRQDGEAARVVILLTDGRETVATLGGPGEIQPREAARLCRQFGIRIYTIALGRRREGEGHRRKPYDRATLQALARIGGGASFEAGDAGGLARIYARIDQLETRERDKPLLERVEQFRFFLLAALLSLGLRILLGATYLEVRR